MTLTAFSTVSPMRLFRQVPESSPQSLADLESANQLVLLAAPHPVFAEDDHGTSSETSWSTLSICS